MPHHGFVMTVRGRVCRRRLACRLLTMHINAVVGRTLGYASAEEYNALLSDVLSDEPLLQTALQDMALRMLEGFSVEPSVLVSRQLVKGTDQHLVLPLILHPFVYRKVQPSGGPSAARSNRQASSMLTSTREQLLPAVVIKYQLSAGLINLIQQLHRGYCMTSTMAHSCTIFDLRGRVLHQNKVGTQAPEAAAAGPGKCAAACACRMHTRHACAGAERVILGSLHEGSLVSEAAWPVG